MNGILYRGQETIPNAADFLTTIAEVPHLYITNDPIRPPNVVAERLAAMGLPRPRPEPAITSAEATARWLAQTHPVGLVAVGHGDDHVGVLDAGTLQHIGMGATTGHRRDVEPILELLQSNRIQIHEGDVVGLTGQALGEGGADLAGAEDEYLQVLR